MKLFSGLFVLFVVILTVAAEHSEADEKMFAEQAGICQKETKATDKDVKDMLDGVEPTTKVAKCLNACFMNKLGIMDDSNKLVPDKLVKFTCDDTTKSKDGKTLSSAVKDIAEACKTVTDADKCESAVKILSCLNAEAKKLGFDKNVF